MKMFIKALKTVSPMPIVSSQSASMMDDYTFPKYAGDPL
jgi:hypothetical protein